MRADNWPSVTFESLTFSDGTLINLEAADVVVLVGPNNVGKSAALRELESHITGRDSGAGKVVKAAKPRHIGTQAHFRKFVESHSQIKFHGGGVHIQGSGINLSTGSNFENLWPNQVWHFGSLFCSRILTERRISDSNSINSIDPLHELPSHPIHMLLDDRVELRISRYFQRAFDEDLILYRGGGTKAQLLTGERKTPRQEKGEDRASATYWEWLLPSTVPLEEQGDGMRSFASVVLHLLASTTPSILLLDEPEAFLHPPQARLLGEIIATERTRRSQLFVATHSPDVLRGLINAASENLQILRMSRKGNINRIKRLDKGLARDISIDPLMKYSNVLSGVFHERVIVCEGDADCTFYSSILDILDVHGGQQPDVLFIHAGGKDRMASLAEILVALDVPVDVVADIDVLRNENELQKIIQALGGDWAEIQPAVNVVSKAIENSLPTMSIDQIKHGIRSELDEESPDGESEGRLRLRINAVFNKLSPWDYIKRAGVSALPPGEATERFQELQASCGKIGLWIVAVGELEGFCKSIPRHGPRWVQEVIKLRDLRSDSELEPARRFVHDIWRGNQ